MATPIPSPITPGSRMPDPPLTGPEPQWRVELRAKIEKELSSMVEKARQEKEEKLRSLPPDDDAERQRVEEDFDSTMKTLRRLANEQFREGVRDKMMKGNVESLIKEQQAILDAIQRKRTTSGPDSEGRPSVESPVLPRVPESASDPPREIERDYTPRLSRASDRDPHPRTPSRGPTRPPSITRPSFAVGRYPGSPGGASTSGISPPKPTAYNESYSDRPSSGMASVNRRTSNSSLSSNKARQDMWMPGSSPTDPITGSRTLNYAASPPPMSPTMRRNSGASVTYKSGIAASSPPRPPMQNAQPSYISPSSPPPAPQSPAPPKRSGLTSSAPQRPSPPTSFMMPPQYQWPHDPYDEDMQSPKVEKAEKESLEQRRGSRSKPRDIPQHVNNWDGQRSSGIRHRSSASDFQSRPWDARSTQSPITVSPPISPDYTRSPDPSRPSPSNYSGNGYRRPEGEERGIPIPASNRTYRPIQGSPEYSRNFPSSIGSGRPLLNKSSFTIDEGNYTQTSPNSARAWTGPGSPIVLRRQESGGSQRSVRSVRSQSSKQEVLPHGDIDGMGPPRPLTTYEEQSDSDYGDYDLEWEDSAWDVEALDRRTEEAHRKEEEARRKEAEIQKREEEARRLQAEAKKKEEAALRQSEEADRRAEEAARKEEEAKRKEEEANLQAEQARQKEEEARRKEEETRRKEEEVKRLEEEARRKDVEAREKEKLAREKELEAKRRAEELERQQQDIQRREELLRRREEELARQAEAMERIMAAERLLAEERREAEVAQRRLAEQERRLSEERRLEAERQLEAQKRLADLAEERRRQEQKRLDEQRRLDELAEQERAEQARLEEERRKMEAKEKEREAMRLEAERVERLEQERIRLEWERSEAERKERERLEIERQVAEADRLAEERAEREATEAERLEQERLEQERLEQERIDLLEAQRLADLEQEEHEEQERRKQFRLSEESRRASEELDRLAAKRFAEEEEKKRKAELEANDRLYAEFVQEQERKRLEDELTQREEKRRAEILAQHEHFRKQQEAAQKRAAQRERQDSSSEWNRRTGTGFSSASQSAGPVPIPSRDSTSSNASDRTSTASSSSGSSSGASIWSTWSSATGSSQTSNSSRTPSNSSPSAKTPASNWRRPSTSTPAPPQSNSPPKESASTRSVSEEERLWKERQEQQAKKQHEQFRQEQERFERQRRERDARTFSKQDAVRLFDEHERMWKRLPQLDVLSWDVLPWPTLRKPKTIDDLTKTAIGAYLVHPGQPSEKSTKERIKEQIRRWHPDRFNPNLLPKVKEAERTKVHDGAGEVVRHLNELLSSAQSSEALFS